MRYTESNETTITGRSHSSIQIQKALTQGDGGFPELFLRNWLMSSWLTGNTGCGWKPLTQSCGHTYATSGGAKEVCPLGLEHSINLESTENVLKIPCAYQPAVVSPVELHSFSQCAVFQHTLRVKADVDTELLPRQGLCFLFHSAFPAKTDKVLQDLDTLKNARVEREQWEEARPMVLWWTFNCILRKLVNISQEKEIFTGPTIAVFNR